MSAHTLALLAWLSFAAGTSLRYVGEPQQGARLIRLATVALLSARLQARRGL